MHTIISIHALREESDQADETLNQYARISIHALREESDGVSIVLTECPIISIHALREESDITSIFPNGTGIYFNPRSP